MFIIHILTLLFAYESLKYFKGGAKCLQGGDHPLAPLNEPLNTHMLNIMTHFVLKVGIVTTEYKNF